MPQIEPLPFRIRIPGKDVIDLKGVRSVNYRVEGLLHLDRRRFMKQAHAMVAAIDQARVSTALPTTGNSSAIEDHEAPLLKEGGDT